MVRYDEGIGGLRAQRNVPMYEEFYTFVCTYICAHNKKTIPHIRYGDVASKIVLLLASASRTRRDFNTCLSLNGSPVNIPRAERTV